MLVAHGRLAHRKLAGLARLLAVLITCGRLAYRKTVDSMVQKKEPRSGEDLIS